MTDPFTITINYNDSQQDFAAQLLQQGYSYKFKVLIDELEVFFEPDDEGSFRVIKMPGQDQKALEKLDKKLLFEIQQQLESIIK
ncbi:MAG TPA: hypothetical protein VK787_07920 [Puia sp.]|jgi:hypothetical protein|nr:hypothetical protein [Puia sp.]